MNADEYFDQLEVRLTEAVEGALEETGRETVVQIRSHIEPRRVLTRQAVTVIPQKTRRGMRLRFGLRFRNKLPVVQGTPSHGEFRRAWRATRPRFFTTFRNKLNDRIERI